MAKKKPAAQKTDLEETIRLVAPFTLRFFGALFVGSLLFSLGGVHQALEPVQRGLAAAGAFGARLLGTDARADGDRIAVGKELVLMINHECTGIFVLLLWAALLLARRTSWKTRLWSFVTGVALIQAVNIARLATLAAIGDHWPSLFAYFHEYVWQGLFVALIATMAATWPDDVEEQRLVPR